MEVPELIRALNRAGWSIGHTAFAVLSGLVWLVSGTNGENRIAAEGATELEAWQAACEQARMMGMLKGGLRQ
ncbi:MAG: hypothetical protein KGL39_46130 [Patescibacteria group bacterium]|nr:hypothetical protein [Patescibacteria group bacterium]